MNGDECEVLHGVDSCVVRHSDGNVCVWYEIIDLCSGCIMMWGG